MRGEVLRLEEMIDAAEQAHVIAAWITVEELASDRCVATRCCPYPLARR